ncbi:hypothetical protein KBZ00_27005 [Streptomyces sp. RK31]|uniref:hypothetical protein n=1 Tax=Streptomyces sp. RK31 TaxID=2824892 RepID=UPI001B388186|nr:hypothetical protein [Streptomyces sp. RK31]MBQ0974750.1 hypothetical protein [Streptomyces sp. RK31]
MDAGIAAVLGAVCGSISGVIGSVSAGRAQRESVLMTVRAEQLKEKHQPRRDAYKAFLQVLLDLDARLNSPAYEDSTAEEEQQLRSSLDARWIDVVLAGPWSITVVGSAVRDAVDSMVSHMGLCRRLQTYWLEETSEDIDAEEFEAARQDYEDAINQTDDMRKELHDCINAFAAAATKILDEDGTEGRRGFWRRFRRKRRSAGAASAP